MFLVGLVGAEVCLSLSYLVELSTVETATVYFHKQSINLFPFFPSALLARRSVCGQLGHQVAEDHGGGLQFVFLLFAKRTSVY